uniref:Putative secreted protein n=1 Tax=Anopheles darlingi TaxID=43151 RepID=A0A2M4DA49_ANODA
MFIHRNRIDLPTLALFLLSLAHTLSLSLSLLRCSAAVCLGLFYTAPWHTNYVVRNRAHSVSSVNDA